MIFNKIKMFFRKRLYSYLFQKVMKRKAHLDLYDPEHISKGGWGHFQDHKYAHFKKKNGKNTIEYK